MSVDARAWVAACEPAPPPALATRLADALVGAHAEPNDAAPSVAEQCAAAAERALREALSCDPRARDTALALLTADALATYAFEAAAMDPHALPALARDTLQRLAALGRAP